MRLAAGAGYTPAIDKNAPLGMSVLGDDTPHLSCPFGSLCLNTFCIFSHPERERGTSKRNVTVVGGMEPHVPARASSSALLMQLQQIEEAVARQMIPEERVVILHRISKAHDAYDVEMNRLHRICICICICICMYMYLYVYMYM
jgi:hypothetical protein